LRASETGISGLPTLRAKPSGSEPSGAGKDVERGGQKIERAADKAKD